MAVGCIFLALGILTCTNYNALELLHDLELTSITTELELKDLAPNIHIDSVITYNEHQWPVLKTLWLGTKPYICQEGFCKELQHKTTTPLQSSTPAAAPTSFITHSSNGLSDVGVILMVFGSVITSILFYCLAVCMEWQRRCIRCVRAKYRDCRGLESESESEDEAGNLSTLEHIGREIRERMDHTSSWNTPLGTQPRHHSTPRTSPLGTEPRLHTTTLSVVVEEVRDPELTNTALETANESHEIKMDKIDDKEDEEV